MSQKPNSDFHHAAFLRLADEAKKSISEIDLATLRQEQKSSVAPILIDVREDQEWEKGSIPGAFHASRGVIEQKIAEVAPQLDTPIVCYCAGGNRSALAAKSLQDMGYTKVSSLIGGFRAWSAEAKETSEE